MQKLPKLDDLDEKILALLRDNARIPLSEIAKRINRSRTAVQARVQKLEDNGVILGYTTRQDRSAENRVSAMITIYLHERLDPSAIVALLREFPEVRYCYRISGDADLLVELSEGPHDRIREICDLLWKHPNVRLTDTVFVMGTMLES